MLHTMTRLTGAQLSFDDQGYAQVDASDLGWRPGEWAELLSVSENGQRNVFARSYSQTDQDGDLTCVVYDSVSDDRHIYIYND